MSLGWQPESRTDEHDACGLVALVDKEGAATHQLIQEALDALVAMRHRAGEVQGEGDGTGLLLDIPRAWWARRLEQAGREPALAYSPGFVVGHFFLPRPRAGEPASLYEEEIRRELVAAGVDVLWHGEGHTCSQALGPAGRSEEPIFYQVAGLARSALATEQTLSLAARLLAVELNLERRYPIHTCSLSLHTVVYKLRGSAGTLAEYYPELTDPLLTTRACIGHNRYSTNTASAFARVQPFSFLGHNGEINTIRALRREAELVGIPPVPDGSDSQDLNRVLAVFVGRWRLSLPEAMELLFPPIVREVQSYPPALRQLYEYYRHLWGPFAQGPAAIFARVGNDLEFSVDALGLRPVWQLETESAWVFSSEPGVIPVARWVSDPRPLAPGEKVWVQLPAEPVRPSPVPATAGQTRLFRYPEIQAFVLARAGERGWPPAHRRVEGASPLTSGSHGPVSETTKLDLERVLAGAGWQQEDQRWVEELAQSGRDPIHSLGYDAPLAALGKIPANLSDYLKETVAVVTNPAIDREREQEHFSTRVLLGRRPLFREPDSRGCASMTAATGVALGDPTASSSMPGSANGVNGRGGWELVELRHPLLVDQPLFAPVTATVPIYDIASLEAAFEGAWARLKVGVQPGESMLEALDRMANEAMAAAAAGARLLVLDDRAAVTGHWGWLDPHLAVARIDRTLSRATAAATADPDGQAGTAVRRSVGLVLRSAGLRNLHDIVVALGLGADAVDPYVLWEVARTQAGEDGVGRAVTQLQQGIEKVLSTLGIHELRGYHRLFSAIGLPASILQELGCPGWAGPALADGGWGVLEQESERRRQVFTGQVEARPSRPFHLYPKIWKGAAAVAQGLLPFAAYERQLAELTQADPVALRHVLEVAPPFESDGTSAPLKPEQVDLRIGDHWLPFVISSMSFGSQSETAYRAYAEAAWRANMICLNGEGGELPDLLGRYWANRGIQIASGRFGIQAKVVNSARYLEIKVGQGAKPGEGGHLPGRKVSAKVAAARHARPGVDLISPSNNHDIYSIEDLAQFIHELKTVNPLAKVIVKVPVVPGIGTIAVGIAKAGADIINVSGFDGGTGAARAHAIRHVGLPAEIGVREAHEALLAAGLRQQVEIWCDGGMKSAADVIKMVLMGANRVGFGTLSMVAIGCTICRGCQLDTCHVGITTQIESEEEARTRGLKRFVPRQQEVASGQLAHFFQALGQEVARQLASWGVRRLQDLVGRVDWLHQVRARERVDLSGLLVTAAPPTPEPVPTAIHLQAHGGHGLQAYGGRQTQPGHGPDLPAGDHHPRAVDHAPCETPASRESLPAAAQEAGAAEVHRFGLTAQVTAQARAWAAAHSGAEQRQSAPVYTFHGHTLSSRDRVMGTHLAGAVCRQAAQFPTAARLVLNGGSVPGNGLAAFNVEHEEIFVEGGAQDGVAKLSAGGRVTIVKGRNQWGRRVGGAVGKSFAYGAQQGLFLVQGDADARACIRLSGADVVFGALPAHPVALEPSLGLDANLKGFAFEYMTAGRVVVLGDPGPWICAGMTGGRVYLHFWPEMGLTEEALRRRLAQGARVRLEGLDAEGRADVVALLSAYVQALADSGQPDEAALVAGWGQAPEQHFRQVVPQIGPVEAEISTE
ncbi:MAG: glutamate synthase [Limnochordaceae bacterium]|nr:glutamate synthase [Limnochordaceae bacterium]